MDNTLQSPGAQSGAANNKPLWAAIGVLGFAVLAMGGTLLYTQSAPNTSEAAAANPASAAALAAATPVTAVPAPATTTATTAPVTAPAKPAAPPAQKVAKTPPPVYGGGGTGGASPGYSTSPQPPVAQTRPVCANCGVVETVTAVRREGQAGGIGAVAGGVLGAVVGNQIGKGSGRTAGTVIGAIGGGFAGNEVEKRMNQVTVYQVRVRMEDGTLRTLEQAVPPTVGARVVIDANGLRAV